MTVCWSRIIWCIRDMDDSNIQLHSQFSLKLLGAYFKTRALWKRSMVFWLEQRRLVLFLVSFWDRHCLSTIRVSLANNQGPLYTSATSSLERDMLYKGSHPNPETRCAVTKNCTIPCAYPIHQFSICRSIILKQMFGCTLILASLVNDWVFFKCWRPIKPAGRGVGVFPS